MKEFEHPKFPTIRIKLLNRLEDTHSIDFLLSDTPYSANDLIEFTPTGISDDTKYLYGIFDRNKLVGIIDLIEEYPTKETAFIHAFYISSAYDNDHLADVIYLALEKTVQETGISSFELDKTLANLPFFKELGFKSKKKIFLD